MEGDSIQIGVNLYVLVPPNLKICCNKVMQRENPHAFVWEKDQTETNGM